MGFVVGFLGFVAGFMESAKYPRIVGHIRGKFEISAWEKILALFFVGTYLSLLVWLGSRAPPKSSRV